MSFQPTPTQVEFLLSAQGQVWLEQAAQLPLTQQSLLADLQHLRQHLSPDMAAAVIEQVSLRRKGTDKFSHAQTMLFIRDGLEQATPSQVAQHRAQRFQGCEHIADLGCGLGGDTLHLAQVAESVLGVDLNPQRLQFARHNATVYNLNHKITWVQADALQLPLRPKAIFADPARRTDDGRRTFNPAAYRPPLQVLIAAYKQANLAIKVGPGLDFAAVQATTVQAPEIELVSLAGEVKEATLWFGDLASSGCTRRATMLPSGDSLTDALPTVEATDAPQIRAGAYIYEPDPAIIRAGLVGQLAHQQQLHFLDPHIAYLTGEQQIESPLTKAYQVEAILPLRVKAINRYLKGQHISQIDIKQRGTGLQPERIAAQLKPAKDGTARTLILVRIKDDHFTLICNRIATCTR